MRGASSRPAPPAPWRLRRRSARWPRSARADAGCSRPSSRRGSRRSARSRCCGSAPSVLVLLDPRIDDGAEISAGVSSRQRQVVARRKADHPADAALRSRRRSARPRSNAPSGVIRGSSAAKSLSNTNVCVVGRDCARRRRAGCRGTGSTSGRSAGRCSGAGAARPGLARAAACDAARPAPTRRVSGLKRRCETLWIESIGGQSA